MTSDVARTDIPERVEDGITARAHPEAKQRHLHASSTLQVTGVPVHRETQTALSTLAVVG